jgi:hypothetical protein
MSRVTKKERKAEMTAMTAATAVRALEIVRALAADGPYTSEDNNGHDYCRLCGEDLPWVKLGERQMANASVCPRHPDDRGHYAVGSMSFCGELRVPVMVDRNGVSENPALHHSDCPWRMARELVAAVQE